MNLWVFKKYISQPNINKYYKKIYVLYVSNPEIRNIIEDSLIEIISRFFSIA